MPRNTSSNIEEISEHTADYSDVRPGINFKCPRCAGTLIYSIKGSKMQCQRCESLFRVRDLEDPTAPGKKGDTPEMETVEHRCPSCGARLHSTQTGLTSFCSFCGSDAVLTERVSRIRRPDKIIPFTVTREKCAEIYRERIKQSPFVPDEMKTEDAISRFRPVYIPFWCISGKGDGPFFVHRTEVKTEGENYRVQDYEDQRTGTVSVSDLCYDASSQFDDETAQWLQFDVSHAVPFHPAYLSGFYAEAADTKSEDFRGLARDYASKCLEYSTQTLPDNFRTEAQLVLMPVWLLPSRQGEKVVHTAIKGDGVLSQIHCELPVSQEKFTRKMGILAILLTALVVLLHHYILLRPQITAGLSCVLAALCWNSAAPFLEKVNLRDTDNDPTRKMLGKGNTGGDISKYVHIQKQQKEYDDEYKALLIETLRNPTFFILDEIELLRFKIRARRERMDPRFAVSPKVIFWFSLMITLLIAGITLSSRNRLRAVNSLISDESMLPSLLAFLSGILLVMILTRKSQMETKDRFACLAQILLCGVISVLRVFQPDRNLFYLISIAGFVLTLLVMLDAFRKHNQYVSRPVPFFDGQEGEK